MMQFVRKNEQIAVHQQSLLAAVDVQIRSESMYMTDGREGAGRSGERQFPANPYMRERSSEQSIIPVEVAEQKIQPVAFSHPTNSYASTHAHAHAYNHDHGRHITSGRGRRKQHSAAIHRPSFSLQRKEEFEPLPFVTSNVNAKEHSHVTVFPSAPEAVYHTTTTEDIFRQSTRTWENDCSNQTSVGIDESSYFLADVMAITSLMTEKTQTQKVSSGKRKASIKDSDLPSGLPPQQKQRQQKQQKSYGKGKCDRDNQRQHNNDSLALALGGRDDFIRNALGGRDNFIRRDFHEHALSESDIPCHEYGVNNGYRDDEDCDHDHNHNHDESIRHTTFDKFFVRRRSQSY